MLCGVPDPRWVYIGRNVEIPKYGQSLGCPGCPAIATVNNRSISHNSECQNRVESAIRDEAVGAERLECSKRQEGEVAPRQDVLTGESSSSSGAGAGSGEVPASPETPRTAEYAEFLSLQDRAESRRVQSAHGELMRLGELGGRSGQVAACSTCSLKLLST